MVSERGEDEALVARIAGGDRVALELLYHRHAAWLLSRLERRCGDADLADLALQDTFVAVWKNARSFRGDGVVGAWLWGIAVRRLTDQLRKRRPVPTDITIDLPDPSSLDGVHTSADGIDGDLSRVLARLPEELRAVLVVTAVDGLTTKEAAHLLGIPQGTVKTRLARARRVAQEEMER
jgi:RNA polymerase sigma-70 factor (ECF subfamily)